MDSTENHDASLINAVEGATLPETQKPIPLTEELKQIGVDVTHVAGSTVDELINGEGRDTRDRVAISRNPISLIKQRLSKLRLWK